MDPIKKHTGIVAPLDRPNIDTDAIDPKQFLRKTERTGFGKHLFHEWRYLDYEGTKENPDFVLNKPIFRNATVLLTRDNFGCGSSREHAPWALLDYGFKVIIAPSFADIFFNNCGKNGIVPVCLKSSEVETLFKQVNAAPGAQITADLEKLTVSGPDGAKYSFGMDNFMRTCLLNGLDQIGWTLQFAGKINDYESRLKNLQPWLA